MKVLIVGENEINAVLEQEMARHGVEVQVISKLEKLNMCSSKESTTQPYGIIITEPPTLEDLVIGEGRPLKLTQPDLLEELEKIDSSNFNSKIVFLLDYISETPEYLTAKALEYALSLAYQGKQVVFLSRFVKTSSNGMERVYREARQEGVTFIKYESIDCNFQNAGSPFSNNDSAFPNENGTFFIKAFDGVFTTELSTPFLIAVGKERGDDQIIQKFRLAKTNGGYINGNKFFLHPVSTSRRGVFYFNPCLQGQDMVKNLREAVQHIISELQALNAEPVSYVEINADKCAFCYSCYRVCPHAALEPDIENNAMKCIENACFSCGACAAVCPGQAISIKGEIDFLNRKIYCCENLGLEAETIPCGGRIGQDLIASALAVHDKVLVLVCQDDACRHIVGGKRGCQLAQAIGEIDIPGKEVSCIKASHAMKNVLAEKCVF